MFPQMKPERKALELTEEEKTVLELLKAKSPIDLNGQKSKLGGVK